MGIAAAVALAPQIIALIQQGIVGATLLWGWITNLRTAAKQSGEWTPEAEEAFINALISKANDPAYQPDPPVVLLGNIPGIVVPTSGDAPVPTNLPMGAIPIIKIIPSSTPGRETWCNSSGDCWMVKPAQLIKQGNLYIDQANGMKFWLGTCVGPDCERTAPATVKP